MNEQEQKMLKEVVALSRENSKALHKLVVYNKRITILHTIYWIIIIGSALAAYYSIQTYWTSLVKIYSGQSVTRVFDSFKPTAENPPK